MNHNGRTTELLDLAPPRDVDKERALLSSAFRSPDQADSVFAILKPSDFTDAFHREIFRIIQGMHSEGQAIEIDMAVAKMKESKLSQPFDLVYELTRLAKSEATGANADYYADELHKLGLKRGVLSTGEWMIQASHNGKSVEEIFTGLKEYIGTVEGKTDGDKPLVVGCAELMADYSVMQGPIVDGLIRRGETANVIAAPKVGKSWLAYGLAISVAAGQRWLERFQCQRVRTLIIDNELHKPTLANRIPKVAKAMGLDPNDYQGNLDILSLRGRLLDLNGIAGILSGIQAGEYGLIILDAFYRVLPTGVSENDNGGIMRLFNEIDAMAKRLDCSWLNIHHSSKGSQADKEITDIGAGAGSQSRAADCHIAIRPHEESGAAVLEAVVRSFKPVDPLPMRWEFPLWVPDLGLDVTKLKGRLTRQETRQTEKDVEGKQQILDILKTLKATERIIRDKTHISRDRCQRLLAILRDEGEITFEETKAKGNMCRLYSLK